MLTRRATFFRWFVVLLAVGAVATVVNAQYTDTSFVVNPDMEGGSTASGNDDVPNGWTKLETTTTETSVVSVVTDNGPSSCGSTAASFLRSNGGRSGDWTAMRQSLDLTTAGYDALELLIDVKPISHDLCGGGLTGAWEYPVTVKIEYYDSVGVRKAAQVGWYIHTNAACDATAAWRWWPSTSRWTRSRQVPANAWSTEAINLLDPVLDIARIVRLTVGGAGWNFEGRADNVWILGVRTGCLQVLGNPWFEEGHVFAPQSDPNDLSLLTPPGDEIPSFWAPFETFYAGVPETSQLLVLGPGFNGPTMPGCYAPQWIRYEGQPGPPQTYWSVFSGDWTALEQPVGVEFPPGVEVRFDIDVWAALHDLGGSGALAANSEYPVTAAIHYIDWQAARRVLYLGWYLDPVTSDHDPNGDGQPGGFPDYGMVSAYDLQDMLPPATTSWAIPASTWTPFSVNLRDLAPDLMVIEMVRVGGSGWSFEGSADNVRLLRCDPGP